MTRRVKVSDGRGMPDGLVELPPDRVIGAGHRVLADTYKGPWTTLRGVFADLAAAVADGATARRVGQLCGDRVHGFGAKVTTTMWRLVDERIDAAHLPGVRDARAAARAAAWARGSPASRAAAASTWTPRWCSTIPGCGADLEEDLRPSPLLAFLDRPRSLSGEALAGLLGNAGPNTAADHITVLDQALASLPARWPDPDADGAPAVVRCDSAGATHKFAQACRDRGPGSPSASRRCLGGTRWTPQLAGAGTRPSIRRRPATGRGPPPWSRRPGPGPLILGGGHRQRSCGSPTSTACG